MTLFNAFCYIVNRGYHDQQKEARPKAFVPSEGYPVPASDCEAR